MAAPNLIAATIINGKTGGVNLATTSATSVISNAATSGKCLKVNILNIANNSATAANVTVSYYNAADIGGTAFIILGTAPIPPYSTLTVIDKSTQYYLEENSSLGVTAGTSGVLSATYSYEDIS